MPKQKYTLQGHRATQVLSFAFSMLSMTGCDLAAAPSSVPSTRPADARACAVVELFTSEGCSSCPSADEALRTLVKDATEAHRPIFALSFHVDYWNRLGWADRFSNAENSRRQSRYAEVVGPADVYTPQMFVNGSRGFVGSDRATAAREIATALEKPAAVEVTLKMIPTRSGVTLNYAVTKTSRRAILNVAVVQREATTAVRAGENGGRTLRHVNVVRWFQSCTLDRDGIGKLEIPANSIDPKNAALIGYVQDVDNLSILGAAQCELP